MIRTVLIAAGLASTAIPPAAFAAETPTATLYKNPQCECCESYASYLRDNGFEVTVKPTHDLPLIQKMADVPKGFEGCHTMGIDGYIVEGHVPVKALKRLLTERPKVRGISLPGMPQGSPGMTGRKTAPLVVYEFSGGATKVYAVE